MYVTEIVLLKINMPKTLVSYIERKCDHVFIIKRHSRTLARFYFEQILVI